MSGCAYSIMWLAMTEKKEYKELIKDIPDIPQGYGRIFIYSPKGDPSFQLNRMSNIDFFSIDKIIYRFAIETYFYLDIEIGSHLITATNVVVIGFYRGNVKKQSGQTELEINLENKQVIYLRFANRSESKFVKDRIYDINVVDKNRAEIEIANLTFLNHHETDWKIE